MKEKERWINEEKHEFARNDCLSSSFLLFVLLMFDFF
jgi:hypothetical protein